MRTSSTIFGVCALALVVLASANTNGQALDQASGAASASAASAAPSASASAPAASTAGAMAGQSAAAASDAASETAASEPNVGPTGSDRFQGNRFRTTVNVRGGYDTNVYTSSGDSETEESTYFGGGASFTWDLGTQRTQLTLGLNGGADYYIDVTGDDVFYNFGLNFGVTHALTPRFTMGFSTNTSYQSQPDYSIAFASTRQSGNYFYSSSRVFATYLWSPKFQTVTGYTLGLIFYEDDVAAEGGDRVEHNFNQEFRYLWTPTSTLVAEYRYGMTTYQNDTSNESQSHYALLGLDHQLAPRSSIVARAGAQFTTYETSDSDDPIVPYGEFTVNYQAGERTNLAWYNRLGLESSELSGLNERYTYRTGLTASHGLTARVTGRVGAYYSHDEYSGTDDGGFSEDSVDITTSLEYLFSSVFSTSIGYQYSGVLGSTSDRDYDRNKVYMSLNASF